MAKITQVDYEAIPAIARQMRTLGQELNSELTASYASITNLHNYWYGKRYNELVKGFNSMVVGLNELLSLVVGEIPYALEMVANNYGKADKGANVTNAVKTEPKRVAQLAIPNDVGMKFLTNEVTSIRNSVSTNFSKSKDKMSSIEATFNKITWQSEAATAFKSRFKSLRDQIVKSLDEIEVSFKNLMTQTLNDMQSTENANTVK